MNLNIGDTSINNDNTYVTANKQRQQEFEEEFKLLEQDLKDMYKCIGPFIEVRLTNYSHQVNPFQQLNLGFKFFLINFKQIVIESLGLEKLFVIPADYQQATINFGTFKIFYYLLNIILLDIHEEYESDKFFQIFKKFKDLKNYWNQKDQMLIEKKQEDQRNMMEFVENFKNLLPKKYEEILLQIFNHLSLIIKLKSLSDTSPQNLSNLDNLKKILFNELGINQNDPQIDKLIQEYSSHPRLFQLNKNRINGFMQFLYEKLMIYLYFEFGQALSEKIHKRQILSKEITATFFRFPDKLQGENLPNCQFVNFYRDLLEYCYKNQKESNEVFKQQMKNCKVKREQLLPNYSYQVQITLQTEDIFNFSINKIDKSDRQANTIYQFENICEINIQDFAERDKKMLQISTLDIFQNNEQLTHQNISLQISGVLNTLEQLNQNENKINAYEIQADNINNSINSFIEEIKTQELDEQEQIIKQNNLYNQSYQKKINYKQGTEFRYESDINDGNYLVDAIQIVDL